MAYSSSFSVHQALKDTDTPPTETMAAKETIHSGRLRMAMPTRSPLVMPNWWTRAWASASTWRMVSSKDQRSSS